MEIERDTLREILDITITKLFEIGINNAEKYTDYINMLLRFDDKVRKEKIIILGIKD